MRLWHGMVLLVFAIGCSGGGGAVSVPPAGQLPKLSTGTHPLSIDVPGVGMVRYTLDIPPGYDGSSPRPLVLALHYGYDGVAPEPFTGRGMIDAFRPGLAASNAIVIAPDVVGGDWTDSRNELAAVWLTQSAIASYTVDKKKVFVTGFSMGGQGTWFIASRHLDLFTGALPVAAAPDGQGANWSIPVYVIHSTQDEVLSFDAAKRNADALKAKGVNVEFRALNGLQHFDTGAYASPVGDGMAWLLDRTK